MNDVTDSTQEGIHFYQGSEISSDESVEAIKQKITELSNLKNVSFLLGAGTSSDVIPSMKAMQEKISSVASQPFMLGAPAQELFNSLSGENLEDTLGVLYAKKYYLKGLSEPKEDASNAVNELITYIEEKMFSEINIDLLGEDALPTLELYKTLYQKIALRNKDLSRINIFTTNNDLFNEKALDNLNINYNNGFGGGLDRTFNPARFHYTFSKKVDANLEKYEPLENMVYLYKLHGSISWVEREGNSLFNIQEVPTKAGEDKQNEAHVLIYPTPMKQSQSLGAPYSDLLREFQTKLGQPNSVLFIIGYSFSDEHINNIIYQSMASNSSISIVIFGEHNECALAEIKDSRIYRIFGQTDDGKKVHYFKYIVESLLPDLDENKEKSMLESFARALELTTKKEVSE